MNYSHSVVTDGIPGLPFWLTPKEKRNLPLDVLKSEGIYPAVGQDNPDWNPSKQERIIDPSSLSFDGEVVTFQWKLIEIPRQDPIPDAPGFYNDLASSSEYEMILGHCAAHPATTASVLLPVAIATVQEAKSYQQSGGKNVSFERVQASFDQLIAALPDEIGDFSKTDIVTKINEIAAANNVPIELN
jgi:hypothetical protein